MKKYIEIQNEVIRRYRIDLCDGTKCKDGDWSRTHAHPKLRRICKWDQRNSLVSTVTLFHEIGHIENNTAGMRRAEQEYHATTWAMDLLQEYGLLGEFIASGQLAVYQRYIDMEIRRGQRRGGKDYGNLDLFGYADLPKTC